MDMDFAVSCPLVRHWRLISGFCSSTRTFDPCFLQTPPRGGSPCIITSPSPPSGWAEDFHLQAAEHAQHTTKPLARQTLRVLVGRGFLFDYGLRSRCGRSSIGRCSITGMLTIEPCSLLTSSGVSIQIPIMARVCPKRDRLPSNVSIESAQRYASLHTWTLSRRALPIRV